MHREEIWITKKFFQSYPKYHILRFLIKNQRNRKVLIIFEKILFYYYKIHNQLEIDFTNLNVEKYIKTNQFLVASNHQSERDFSLLLSYFAQLNRNIFFLTGNHRYIETSNNKFVVISRFFTEQIPTQLKKANLYKLFTKRIKMQDICGVFPAGGPPLINKYKNSGLVQKPFIGVAKFIYNYQKSTGKTIPVIPICIIGANKAFPAYVKFNKEKFNRKSKIKIIIGTPLKIRYNLTNEYSKEQFLKIALFIQKKIAHLKNQEILIPNIRINKIEFQNFLHNR